MNKRFTANRNSIDLLACGTPLKATWTILLWQFEALPLTHFLCNLVLKDPMLFSIGRKIADCCQALRNHNCFLDKIPTTGLDKSGRMLNREKMSIVLKL
jgi:hypothetical protein